MKGKALLEPLIINGSHLVFGVHPAKIADHGVITTMAVPSAKEVTGT